MSEWLERLIAAIGPKQGATKATKRPNEDQALGFDGFVAYPSRHFQNFEGTPGDLDVPAGTRQSILSRADAARHLEDLNQRLLSEAMAVCDLYGDGPDARAAMREECLAVEDHLKPDLLDYLTRQANSFTYGRQAAEMLKHGQHPTASSAKGQE